MPWIENVSAADIPRGHHCDAGPNSMLIQIADPAGWFPTSQYKFAETHQFEFLDMEDEDLAKNPDLDGALISREQAQQLVALLRYALAQHMNVVVHCFAGLCRSGAVAQVGMHMGFDDVGNFKSPNTRVMQYMMEELGLPYEVKPHNWREDWRQYMSAKFD